MVFIVSKLKKALRVGMPLSFAMRAVVIDDSTPIPTFWVGSNHAHALVKLEPLD